MCFNVAKFIELESVPNSPNAWFLNLQELCRKQPAVFAKRTKIALQTDQSSIEDRTLPIPTQNASDFPSPLKSLSFSILSGNLCSRMSCHLYSKFWTWWNLNALHIHIWSYISNDQKTLDFQLRWNCNDDKMISSWRHVCCIYDLKLFEKSVMQTMYATSWHVDHEVQTE